LVVVQHIEKVKAFKWMRNRAISKLAEWYSGISEVCNPRIAFGIMHGNLGRKLEGRMAGVGFI